MFASRGFRLASLFACVVMAFSMVSIDTAEARRGGSFGSRGTRTFNSAPATNTSPNTTAPIERSMTPAQQTNAQPGAQTAARNNPMNGFGGSLMRGLMFGGLLGLLFGGGFGGFAGFLGLIVQVLLIGFGLSLLMRAFSRRSPQAATAGAGAGNVRYTAQPQPSATSSTGYGSAKGRDGQRNRDEIGVKPADLDTFEDILGAVQTAFGREDYDTLRRLTTPEMMSYLSEELGSNASKGLKNEVSEVKLLQGDISESWREGSVDYATTAMRYSSIDATRERSSGRVVDGDAEQATETRELWTFMRNRGSEWKLSAIQEA